MDREPPTEPAGAFAAWSAGLAGARRGEHASEVPCGTCTACCTSSQFVHVDPDEADALAHIPAELLFPAPGLPAGHAVLGYDERGRCPMLAEGGCSIYEHRPRACRTYDCRIFPAAGVVPDEPGREAVAERARRWRFDHPTPADRAGHDAVRAAAAFLRARGDEVAPGLGQAPATQLALAAVDAHPAFLGGGDPGPAEVRVALERSGRARPQPPAG